MRVPTVALRPKHLRKLTANFLSATAKTNPWVFSGGTAGGVMKLLGHVMSCQPELQTPLMTCIPHSPVVRMTDRFYENQVM